MYQLVSAPLTGVSQPEGWSQVVTHPEGQFVCAISLNGKLAHQVGHEITQLFLNSQFNSALELHQFTEQLLERCKTAELTLQFAAQLLTDQTCVMCSYQGFVYLQRAAKIGLILPVQERIQIVEGKIHADDVYVLGTASAAMYEQPLQKILSSVHEPEAFVTQLMQHVLEELDSSLVATAYVRVVLAPDVPSVVSQPELASSDAISIADADSASPLSVSEVPKEEQPKSMSKGTAFPEQLSHLFGSSFAVLRRLVQPPFSRDVYVRQQSTKKIVGVLISMVVILVLVIGGMFLVRSQQAKQVQAAQAIIQPAEAELKQIKKIATDQPLEARQRTETLMAMLEGKLSQFDQQKSAKSAVQKELNSVKDYYQTISGQQELNVLPTFFDLRLFQSDFLANRMDIQQNNIFFMDPDKRNILALDINTKQTTLLPLGQLSSLKDFTVTDKNVYLLGDEVSAFTLGTNVSPTVLKEADLDTKPATAIRWYNNYIYLLNPDKRNIFRYEIQQNQKLSSPSAWIKPDEKLDITSVQSIAIDGDVWFATKTGEIKRFTSGKESNFTIAGLKEAFSTPLKIFTKDGLQNIYILEPAKNRLVILNKNGTFLKEIRSTTLASASDVVAAETNKIVYILSGSLVYEVQF